jgi:hypothetical protein
MHSGRKGGGVSYILCQEKEVLECRSGLRPSDKELLEQRSGVFYQKNAPVCNYSLQVYDINVSWSSSIDICTRV